jgi:hypothetical protein
MAKDQNDNRTLDLEITNVDRAIRAIRDFQKGQATVSFTAHSLAAVKPQDLAIVAAATRVPITQLERVRDHKTV